jgi:hypothetical protein
MALRKANGLDDVRLAARPDDSERDTVNDPTEICGGCLPRTIFREQDGIRLAKFGEERLPRR